MTNKHFPDTFQHDIFDAKHLQLSLPSKYTKAYFPYVPNLDSTYSRDSKLRNIGIKFTSTLLTLSSIISHKPFVSDYLWLILA